MSAAQEIWKPHHKKSRKGCQTCKSRKVKCDERHPTCGNCARLKVACVFQHQQRGSPGDASSSTTPSQLAPRPQRSDENASSRTLDLRLLHHYLTVACNDFPRVHNQQILKLWTIAVPQMGFAHEFLRDAILSSSAFHLATLLPEDKTLAAVGHKYYGQAVAKHCEALSVVDRFTADPLCLTSVLIMFQTFKISCSFPPVEWFRVLQGMAQLVRLSKSLLADGSIQLLLRMDDSPDIENRALDELRQLQGLSSLLPLTDDIGNDTLDADARAGRLSFRSQVSQIVSAAVAGDSKHQVRHLLLALAATSEKRFLHLTEQDDAVSLILLFHYFSLLNWVGGHWWLQSSLDKGLSYLLSLIPIEYHWAVGNQ